MITPFLRPIKPKTPAQRLKAAPKWDIGPADLKPGMYDPQLDWTGQSEQQGYNFGQEDVHNTLYGQSGTYEEVDPVTGEKRSEQFSTPGSLADLITRRDTALGRGQQDYDTATGNLRRNYQNLRVAQGERARAAGVSGGGALAQAMAKRTENQGRDQGTLDTNWRRFQDDTNRSYEHDRGEVLSGAYTQGTRGTAAHALFGTQLGEAKLGDAANRGTLPTTPPPGMVPSLKTVLLTGSLLGTGLDANSPIYRRPRRKP